LNGFRNSFQVSRFLNDGSKIQPGTASLSQRNQSDAANSRRGTRGLQGKGSSASVAEDSSEKKRYYFYRDQLFAVGAGLAISLTSVFILGIVAGIRLERRMKFDYAAATVKAPLKSSSARADSAGEAQSGQISSAESPSAEPSRPPPSDEPTAGENKEQRRVADAEKTKLAAPVKSAGKSASAAPAAKSTDEIGSVPETQAEHQTSEAAVKDSSQRVWTVQIKSSPDKKFADNWVNRLKAKGYDAFAVEGDVKGRTWYRVRVGRFTARDEAEALRGTLESNERLSGSFVTRHGQSGDPPPAK
jgi:cell division septation protein DedD